MQGRGADTNNRSLILSPLSSSDDFSLLDNAVRLSPRHQINPGKKYIIKLYPQNPVETLPVYYPVIFDLRVPLNKMKLPLRLKTHFAYRNDTDYKTELLELNPASLPLAEKICIDIQRMIPYNLNRMFTINADDFTKLIRNRLKDYPLMKGQLLYFPFEKDNFIEVKIERINNQSYMEPYLISDAAAIEFRLPRYPRNIQLSGQAETDAPPKITPVEQPLPAVEALNLALPDPEHEPGADIMPVEFTIDFKSKGIGGHSRELEQLVRKTFYSRALGARYAEAYGVKHNKGILLYGPPGTGKTLIAREIGKLFAPDKVKVINGPELKNQFVGQSTANLRQVFADAIWDWKLYGKRSPLHVIIIDEIDVLCPRRGTRSGGTGVDDDMVAQLLTLLDGVDSAQNIIVIGLTNRKDLLDPALLRPGRLGVHIEISLPDEKARHEILEIKTADMRANNLLDDDVELEYWARETENYTGAEIESLVQNAAYYAMGGNFDLSSGKPSLCIDEHIEETGGLKKVTQEHFTQAFSEITPAFGINRNNFNFDAGKFVIFNKELEGIISSFRAFLEGFRNYNDSSQLQFLLTGGSGTGKTWLARYLAVISGIQNIRILSPDKLLGLTLQQQLALIDEEFYHAQQSEWSVIILDKLESLLQANAQLTDYNNSLRIKFESLLNRRAESTNKCIIIASTRSGEFLQRMQLLDLFNEVKSMPNVVLRRMHSPESLRVLSLLGKTAGINIEEGLDDTHDKRSIDLPVRALIFSMKRFCASRNNEQILSPDQFYEFVSSNIDQIQPKQRSATPTDKQSASYVNALQNSGSPLHSVKMTKL